jgi:hypothetical protein
MALEYFKWFFGPQFSKLGPATKMALQVDSSNFFHPESTKIDEKLYNDPITFSLEYHFSFPGSCPFNPIFQRSLLMSKMYKTIEIQSGRLARMVERDVTTTHIHKKMIITMNIQMNF